jgi:ABC-type nitrate/sulfonate/bicarbonate transport system ATPase subunit
MIAGARNGEVVLSVEGVSVEREGTSVLENVTFEIVDRIREGCTTGQVVSRLGPSGIGKTTLLRVIAGLDRPTSGSIRGPKGSRLSSRDVGIVFQDYPLLSHRTVIENLVIAGRVGGMNKERATKRAVELLARVGLEGRATYWPAQLSGGQRQRAAIAQQLVLRRRVLLLDEPFSGLDPVALADVMKLVMEVANDHDLNTVVVVTHDVRSAVGVSDRLLLLGANGSGRGASVRDSYDLVDLGIAWGNGDDRERAALEREVEKRFRDLAA